MLKNIILIYFYCLKIYNKKRIIEKGNVMKIFKKIIFVIILYMIIFSSGCAFATTDLSNIIGELEYTEEFKSWLELEENERNKVNAKSI